MFTTCFLLASLFAFLGVSIAFYSDCEHFMPKLVPYEAALCTKKHSVNAAEEHENCIDWSYLLWQTWFNSNIRLYSGNCSYDDVEDRLVGVDNFDLIVKRYCSETFKSCLQETAINILGDIQPNCTMMGINGASLLTAYFDSFFDCTIPVLEKDI